MYDIFSYGRMVSDSIRTDAYVSALRRAVTQDSVVLDMGTGLGVFAVLASQFGARRVIAVEPDNVIEVARKIAAANHCADKIQFIHGLSFELKLHEPVDVIIFDLRGVLPWFETHLPAVVDARKRLLAPEGKLIPARDMVWAALVESSELYAPYLDPWCSRPYGLDLAAARPFAVNRWTKGRGRLASEFLGVPQLWAELDYAVIENLNVASTVTWRLTKAGTAHGILMWFDSDMGGGVGFLNYPAGPQLIYGNAFYPFSEPIELHSGDIVTVELRATLTGKDYVWSWKTMVSSGDPPRVRMELNQSTFFGCPLSHEQVASRSENYVAHLSEDGLIDRNVLDWMDGKMTLGQISDRLLEKFPSRFATVDEALAKVSELSARYTRPRNPSI
jgi:protein arginine N-methyltransferase 1